MNIDDIPYVNWPNNGDGKFKFVQFYLGEKPVLRFAGHPGERNHSGIAIGLLKTLGLDYKLSKEMCTYINIPELVGESYRICGAGNGVLYPRTKKFYIFQRDRSELLSIGLDSEHILKIIEIEPDFDINLRFRE